MGPSTPPIRGNKQYGDQKALDSLKRTGTGLKYDNAAPLPTQRNPVGRPQGSTTTAPAAVGPGIPQEHVALIEDFSRAAMVAQVAKAAAQDVAAGPFLRKYAEIAERQAVAAGERLRSATPFFD